jgi:hypothetical protein
MRCHFGAWSCIASIQDFLHGSIGFSLLRFDDCSDRWVVCTKPRLCILVAHLAVGILAA